MNRPDDTAGAIRAQYAPWIDQINSHFVPWTPWEVPIDRAKVALVSTGGVFMTKGWHKPFDTDLPHGDPSWREMPFNVDPEDLAIAHAHYDHRHALRDINVVFPLQRLHELAEYGYIGSVAPSAYSFSGHVTMPLPLLAEHAPNVAQRLRRSRSELAVLVPSSYLCHVTAALIARTVELAGIPTLCLGTVEGAELYERVRPPRAVVVDHVYGAVLGAPGNAAKHQHLLREAFDVGYDIAEPGKVVTLDRYRWRPE